MGFLPDNTMWGSVRRSLPFWGLLLTTACLVGLAWGVSLLDDDWGHVRLASRGLAFAFSTGWEGLVGQGGYYRPFVVLSFYANYLMGGFSPGVYHATNVLIHAGCSGLVYALGRRLRLSDAASWGGALLFFVLPIHTDTVFWIVGRTDSLCALFYLGALVVFLGLVERPSWRKFAGLGFCVCGALLSKEMALSLPGALAVLALSRGVFRQRRMWRAMDVTVLVFFGYFLLRQQVLGGVFDQTPLHFSPSQWGLDGLKAVAKMGMTPLRWFGAVVLLGTGCLWAWCGRRHGRLFATLGGLTLVSLIPVLGHLHNWYLYLPSAFFCLAVAGVWVQDGQRVFTLLFAGLLLYYAVVLMREGFFWRETSRISEAFLAQALPQAKATEGRLFVLNAPSAWTPEASFSGKPLFAFALKNALAMRSTGPIVCEPVAVNHVWMTRTAGFSCRVTDLGGGRFGLKMARGGFFSFHRADVSSPPFLSDESWGQVQAVSEDSLVVSLDIHPGDRVAIYDGRQLNTLIP